ncbi:mannose-6-phosphate isomerase [Utexia brackfieldae]|uniref:mannose-6-phosphate isomerase n=1 Tax=Utexia brackfieldae TaxID=3074108 RepID=UPI00370D2686
MQKMINGIQHYAWGSHTALTELYGISNPDNQPMAEIWMGAHPLCSSQIVSQGQTRALRDVIASDPDQYLGKRINQHFGELPFLFKVLCAGQPLSIQVHPSKHAAEIGFARENAAGIALTSPQRNYKDANHKPELVFALTPFWAMNGFREFNEIAQLLKPVQAAHPALAEFIAQPDATHLSQLFSTLLSLSGDEKQQALAVLQQQIDKQQGLPWEAIRLIQVFYPDDSGLFSPLLLNVVRLEPGQAMFLYAETPHAYLQGVGLEVMANSDNVLRAGLTPKYIDIPELIANVKFVAKPEQEILMAPQVSGEVTEYPIPVADFAFSLYQVHGKAVELAQDSAAIIFCLSGQIEVSKAAEKVTLKPGESCFVAANESPVWIEGEGQAARVYNK